METADNAVITVETTVNGPVTKIWDLWTSPTHITQWNQASEDWHTPNAENDLRVGGRFKSTMAAKDGSMRFDFSGTYTTVTPHEQIAYTLDDHRKVSIRFSAQGNATRIVQNFEPEQVNPLEMQKAGWQAIMDSFKKYTEAY